MKSHIMSIIERAKGLNVTLAVPMCGSDDLKIIRKAQKLGIIRPVFSGAAMPAGVNIKDDFIKVETPEEALMKAMEMLRESKADILFQSGIRLNDLLFAVLDSGSGIKSRLHTSHACMFFLPGRKTPVLITDTFIHAHPGLTEKQAIIENSIKLWKAIGFEKPKIAALAVLEYVNPKIHSTIDSAVLSKMAERGQFGDALIEGPLDIDCALSRTAALRKGVSREVAGDADIYLVHDAESGYLFAEHLVFIGKLECAGVLLGALKPVIIDMPFFSDNGRLASIAMAALLAYREKQHE